MLASAMDTSRKPMQVLRSTRPISRDFAPTHKFACSALHPVSVGLLLRHLSSPAKEIGPETCTLNRDGGTVAASKYRKALPTAELEHVCEGSDAGPGDEKQAVPAASGQKVASPARKSEERSCGEPGGFLQDRCFQHRETGFGELPR